MTDRQTKRRSLLKRLPVLECLVILGAIGSLCAVFAAVMNVGRRDPSSAPRFEDPLPAAQMAAQQIARDIRYAVPPALVSIRRGAGQPVQLRLAPFAWDPGYASGKPCQVGADCNLPGPFDLIVESDVDPQNNNGTEWVRYMLAGTTLLRAVVPKRGNPDPAAATYAALAPFQDNVLNDALPAQTIAAHAAYPHLFAGEGPQPLFTYRFAPGAERSPTSITEVQIILVVAEPGPSGRSGRFPATVISLAARPW
jgi:hypothetical protein